MSRALAKTSCAVFDTDVMLLALLLSPRKLAWLDALWQAGAVKPLACRETLQELLRVLAYPKFALTREQQRAIFDYVLDLAEVFPLRSQTGKNLPQCRAPHDQIFLRLAHAAQADALVTGDKDLLALAGAFSRPILTPQQFRERKPASFS